MQTRKAADVNNVTTLWTSYKKSISQYKITKYTNWDKKNKKNLKNNLLFFPAA